MKPRCAARGRALGQPLRFPPCQAEEGIDRSTIAQFKPTPFDRTGALAFQQRPRYHSSRSGSFGQPALIVLRKRERGINPTFHEMQPAELSIADTILPRPAPAGTHV